MSFLDKKAGRPASGGLSLLSVERDGSLLERAPRFSSPAALSPVQGTVDQLVSDFSKNATDWKALASITAGSLAYRWGKAGMAGLRGLSAGAGLTAEVTAFETVHRSLTTLSGNDSLPGNLWRWEGRGGLKQGWISSFLTFGTLKGFGKAAQGQNIVLQHAAQDTGMVLGHQWGYWAGLSPKPQGTLAEQYLQAEVTNLQLGAGMALGKGLAPLHGHLPQLPAEKTGSRIASVLSSHEPLLAVEGGPPGPQISMMSIKSDGAGGKKGPPPVPGRASVPPAAPKDPLIGQTIDGRYRIDGFTGRGGMGTVYSATHTTLEKRVAVKVLRTELAKDPVTGQRFLDEAKAASKIKNPHIIDVIDFGRLPDYSPYFVMEYLEGVPLSHIMEGDKPVPVSRLVSIAHQLAEGLAAAHQKDIIHRDLKPGNIFLIKNGSVHDFVKILDFGIAKMNAASELTQAGMILGTPRYMSPEQASGEKVDPRSDIYSFGVLLYKMASGKLPFNYADALKVLQAHIKETPQSLLSLSPAPQEIPPGLDAIILKCLEKDPYHRYQSMAEVMADLEKLYEGAAPDALSERGLKALVPDSAGGERRTPATITGRAVVAPQKAPIQSIIVVPPVQLEPSRSRWPLILGLFGLAGAGALAVAVHTGKIHLPDWAPIPSPPAGGPTISPPPAAPGPSAQDLSTPSAPSAPTVSGAPEIHSAAPVASSTPHAVKKKVEIAITPPDARVFRGGKLVGSSGVVLELTEGSTLEIEIRRDGYKTKPVSLNGSQPKILVQLEKEAKAPHHPKTPKSADSETPEPPPPPVKYEDFN